MTQTTLLRDIPSDQWDKIEIIWGGGYKEKGVYWLKKIGQAIREANNLVRDRGSDFTTFDLFHSGMPGAADLRNFVQMDWNISRGIIMPKSGNPDIGFVGLYLADPFNYRAQNVHENLAFLLLVGGKIFSERDNFRSREALDYLKLIAGGLEVTYRPLQEEGTTPLTFSSPQPYVINNPVSSRTNLAYFLKTISKKEQEALKGRLAILEEDRNYWKLIRDIDHRHWGIIQFVNDNPPFSFANNGRGLVADYCQWADDKRPEWKLPSDPTTNDSRGLFRVGFTNNSYFRAVNEGVIHYLWEKYGTREIRVFYAARHDSNNQNRCLEWFMDEFLNDEKSYMDNVSPLVNFWVNLSNGSGDLINLRSLPKSQREELRDRGVILWGDIANVNKLLKNIFTFKAARDLRILLDGFDFDDFVAKIKAADKDKTKLDKSEERLLTSDGKFSNQSILDEWKLLVNANSWATTPIGGSRILLSALTVNDRLQGGEVSGNWNITGKGANYRSADAYEFIVATLLSDNNTLFRSGRNLNWDGYNFLRRIVKNSDWEQIIVTVNYYYFQRLEMGEFMNDDIDKDIWAFMIDEDRAIVNGSQGATDAENIGLQKQITALQEQNKQLQQSFDELWIKERERLNKEIERLQTRRPRVVESSKEQAAEEQVAQVLQLPKDNN